LFFVFLSVAIILSVICVSFSVNTLSHSGPWKS
jgi:hypothetical protein